MKNERLILPHYPALDGLRGVAILLVILSHHFSFLPFAAPMGAAGVDLFFVLSGFLITNILIQRAGAQDYYRSFYWRRIIRIFPVYYLFLLFYFLCAPGITGFGESLRYYQQQWPLLVFHLNNVSPLLYPKPDVPLPLNHLWSLSLEEQFYLLWPVLVALAVRFNRLPWLLMSVIGLSIVSRTWLWIELGEGYHFWYSATNIRIDCMAAGGLLAYWKITRKNTALRQYTLFAGIMLAAYLILLATSLLSSTRLPAFTLIGITAEAAVFGWMIGFSFQESLYSTLLQCRPLRFLGKISYSLYIIHFPVALWISHRWGAELTGELGSSLLSDIVLGTAGLTIAIFISLLSWKYVENPIRSWGKRIQ